ncbi:hypothetical protein PGTUg99_009706 [Puccinia graminis f. sp. tritici]|uniref:Uncharacterized protein n=1 Tax=Puccinia graminis f. sp. tritici TaxID=56615 RepID=A0A5B0NL71_PUCGR|nr:hypothetical protein PGTUg99_009706 [Puccinia graminis f. sp. tritici]
MKYELPLPNHMVVMFTRPVQLRVNVIPSHIDTSSSNTATVHSDCLDDSILMIVVRPRRPRPSIDIDCFLFRWSILEQIIHRSRSNCLMEHHVDGLCYELRNAP